MKKPYQIEGQRAVRQLEAMAAEGNPAVQMVLPMAEMVRWQAGPAEPDTTGWSVYFGWLNSAQHFRRDCPTLRGK